VHATVDNALVARAAMTTVLTQATAPMHSSFINVHLMQADGTQLKDTVLVNE